MLPYSFQKIRQVHKNSTEKMRILHNRAQPLGMIGKQKPSILSNQQNPKKDKGDS
jgi:hypothetical protein